MGIKLTSVVGIISLIDEVPTPLSPFPIVLANHPPKNCYLSGSGIWGKGIDLRDVLSGE